MRAGCSGCTDTVEDLISLSLTKPVRIFVNKKHEVGMSARRIRT